ncbi:hypothetical protein JB92DRAFT_3121043 [Gautieria morchelliformis]|nr:hypothetical protein JB92DRAFT_3121043 [Gautieria morchelliformis]
MGKIHMLVLRGAKKKRVEEYAQLMGMASFMNLNEVHGGGPFGAGTFAGGDGSRQPSALELSVSTTQGKSFYESVSRTKF